MSYFSFFYIGSDALRHLPMPPGYHFSRKSTAAEPFSILHQNAAALHITLLHTNKLHQNHINTVFCITLCSLYCFVYPLFSFIFLLFLSIFIHFYLFFHIFLFYTSRVASVFTSFFVFVGATAGECGRQAGPGRGSGVYGRQIVCTAWAVKEQKQCRGSALALRNWVAVVNLPAKLCFVFFS